MRPAARRVLVAVAEPARRRAAAILADCDLRFVESCDELLRALDEADHDLLVIGAHFDESSAAALLERVFEREDAGPVVCVRGTSFATRLGKPTVDALRLASEELGAQYFIDLLEFPDDAEGNAHVRRMLERLLIQSP